MTTKIFFDDEVLSFSGEVLATIEQFDLGDRCVGSIFEALKEGEEVELKEGFFVLDGNLDLIGRFARSLCW